MQIFSLAAVALAALACVAADNVSKKRSVTYAFDTDKSGGIGGTIRTTWSHGDASAQVTIETDLQFKQVHAGALKTVDGNCTGRPTEYLWHIHTLWNQTVDSASYAQCAKPITGNHFDPNKACGPASEFAGTPECLAKVASYNCSAARYTQRPGDCEVGDLSGKLGTLVPDKDGKVIMTWTDPHYAMWKDQQPTWNIVIHAKCGASPRVACARMKKDGDDHHKRVQLRVRVNGKGYDLGKHEDNNSEEEKPYGGYHGGHGSEKKKPVDKSEMDDDDDDASEEEKPYGGYGSDKKHDTYWEEDPIEEDSSE